MKHQNIALYILITYLHFAATAVFSQTAQPPKRKKGGTPKRYKYNPKSSLTTGDAAAKKAPKTVLNPPRPPTTRPNRPKTNPTLPKSTTNAGGGQQVAGRRKCRLCTETWSVPDPSLILLDETCSYWNNREVPQENCRNIQATYGSACGCPNAPMPVCDVCPDGNFIWKEAPQYNTFTDDFCVRMIYRMSKRTEFCDGNKRRVANMCCSNTCSRSDAPKTKDSPSAIGTTKDGKNKNYGKKANKTGKSPKSYRTKSEDTSQVIPDYYEGPENYYYLPYYNEGVEYYYYYR